MHQNESGRIAAEKAGENAAMKRESEKKGFAKPKFAIGQLVVTPGVADTLTPRELLAALRRHRRGDWGMVCPEDMESNDKALQRGCRLLSAFETGQGVKFWILTEWDRSVTTVLFPHEY